MQARPQHVSAARSPGRSGLEYGVYFTLVFAISLIPAAARMVVPKAGQPRKFFVTDAWSMAQEVTPMIFSSLSRFKNPITSLFETKGVLACETIHSLPGMRSQPGYARVSGISSSTSRLRSGSRRNRVCRPSG